MKQTNELGLVLPNKNDTNWGESVNNNFIALDATYKGFYSQMENLRNQMGALGLYYVDDRFSRKACLVVEWHTSEQKYFVKEVRIFESNESINISSINGTNMMVPGDSLINYSMFIISDVIGYISSEDRYYSLDEVESRKTFYYNGTDVDGTILIREEWKLHDYIVKTNYFTENGARTPVWKKMPQTVGGYYVPTNIEMGSTYPVIRYTQVPALEAEAKPSFGACPVYVEPYSVVDNKIKFNLMGGYNDWYESGNPRITMLKKDYVVFNYPTLTEKGYLEKATVTGNTWTNTYSFPYSGEAKWFVTTIRFENEDGKNIYCGYNVAYSNSSNITNITLTVNTKYFASGDKFNIFLCFAQQGPIEQQ